MKTTKLSFFYSVIPVNRSPEQSVWRYVRNLILSFFSSVIANPLKRMKQSLYNQFKLLLRVSTAISIFFLTLPSLAFAEEKIPVFPTTPVDVYTIYTSLAVFWLAIIGLIVVIKMKLNEIERIQKLGIDKEDANAPILD